MKVYRESLLRRLALRCRGSESLLLIAIAFWLLLMVAGCGGETAEVAQTASASASRPAVASTAGTSGPVSARVVLCNIRLPEAGDGPNAWPNRRDLLVRTLKRAEPDVIGMQEVSPVQGAFLIKELPEMGHYPDGSDETGTLAPLTSMASSLNMIMFRKERFELVGSAHGPVRASGVDAKNIAFYTMAVLRDRGQQLPELIVINTHLRHDQRSATQDARELNNRVTAEKRLRPGAEVVMLGDFNHDKFTPVHRALTGDPGVFPANTAVTKLTDTYDYAKMAPGTRWGSWHAFSGQARGAWPSDLVLVSGGIAADAAQVIREGEEGRYPSDHFPVVVNLRRAK